ncbi:MULTISPECIES: allantoicase [Catenuloplanes]|uniref:Probable allantoicase n=1 Tax=Catenuloplanes niger TaxID=587534 RepID=A0AAE3ZT49_9ACTN|nr:allantoicase [Catenuloplanes niger]MDR7325609.1 allantoicase [Catenuloplanes niger]
MTGWQQLPDLAARAFGGGVVHASDEFFAFAADLINDHPPTFTPQSFGARGQLYDGWETRRRRPRGTGDDHDLAIVRLGAPGVIHGVVIDTAFFTGNYPPAASVEATRLPGHPSPEELLAAEWTPVLARSALTGDTRNEFPVDGGERVHTHVRLRIYPDGGVARLRVHGEAVPDPALLPEVFDLAAAENGGTVTACSNMFYGSAPRMLLPGLARSMGEGWETSRRRDDGNDWALVRLGVPGRIQLAEIDTSHFKGNAPGEFRLRGIPDACSLDSPGDWVELLPRTRAQPDTRHRFAISDAPKVTHVRLDVYPDGGVARLRLWGSIAEKQRRRLAERHF